MSALKRLMELQQGWDGYSGKPIALAAYEVARNLVFVPGSDGGIQIELHAGGIDLELGISPDGTVTEVYVKPVHGESVMWEASEVVR